jgi:catalase
VHTDIVAHSANGFPVRTGEEFLEMLWAVAAAGAGKPEAIGRFLAEHPNAKRFAEAPNPVPSSFAREAYFSPTAFRFTNDAGISRYGRFRICPNAGTEYLTGEQAAGSGPNFLFDEMAARITQGPVGFGVFVQVAEPGDDVADASTPWPDSRPQVAFGKIALDTRLDDGRPELRKVIFDPMPRVDGVDPSGDPLTDVRADIYLMSGRRRRKASNN